MENELTMICNKLGVTSEYLISEYSNYLKITSVAEFFIALAVMILSIHLCKVGFKKVKEIDYDLDFAGIFMTAFGAIGFIICIIVMCIKIHIIFGLLTSPTATVIDYILTSLGG